MARLMTNWKSVLLRHATGHHRHRSTQSRWMEIEDVKLLEEHVHRIAVKNATPDWLPFLPGSSFWLPPPPSPSPFLHKFSISSQLFFIQESSNSGSDSEDQSGHVNRNKVTVQLNLLTLPQNLPLSEDDEG